jgi:hypothetical protein
MLRSHLQLFGFVFTLSTIVALDASAQTECDSVLKTALKTSSVKSSAHDQASFSFACSHDFEEFNDTYGGSASGQYLAISGSGDYNQTNYKKFQHDKCSQAAASDHQTNFEYNTLQDASAGVVTAWQACMANLAGFHCWAERESGDIGIVLSLKDPGAFRITSATLSPGLTARTPMKIIAPNAKLSFGKTMVVVARSSVGAPASFTVNVMGPAKGDACRVLLPAAAVIPAAESIAPKAEIILIQAIDFDPTLSKNVAVATGINTQFGEGKIILSYPPGHHENKAVWKFKAAAAGQYTLLVEYAAAESRPVSVETNGNLVLASALADTTGGWNIDKQKWFYLGSFKLKAGDNMITL